MSSARSVASAAVALAVMAAACGGGEIVDLAADVTTTQAVTDESISTTATVTPTTVVDEETSTTAPTTTGFDRQVDVSGEPPPWQDVSFATVDGITLNGKYWPGTSDVAVLVQHDFDDPDAGSPGERDPQSSDNTLLWAGVVADAGYTVLSFDFRGHGLSGGEFNVRESPADYAAAHAWLAGQGFDEVILLGFLGSATSGVVVDAETDFDYAGIAFLFSPPQDYGLDANAAIPQVDTPMWFVGSDGGSTASWARRMEAKAVDSYGVHVFDRTPTGLQFVDVFGTEFAGRILDFVDAAAASV